MQYLRIFVLASFTFIRSLKAGEIDPREQLAARVIKTYENLRGLEMKIEVSQNDETVEIHTWMAPHRFRTDAYKKSDRFLSILFDRGNVREIHPSDTVVNTSELSDLTNSRLIKYAEALELNYTSESQNETGAIYIDTGIDCQIGTYLSTWVGSDTRMIRILDPRLRNGRLIDHKDFYEILIEEENEDPKTCIIQYLKEDIWIRKSTLLVERFDTRIAYSDGQIIERHRSFKIISTKPIPSDDQRWNENLTTLERNQK